ncbi:MAG: aminoglycoside phosphotransferase family protein [Pseudomonadota bacterium]|nr:aminoglycoside phosphotransferase family protein [Pseudomonadota bacterium]
MSERTELLWDAGGANLDALAEATGKIDIFRGIGFGDLEPMRAKGLVHAHVRVPGTGAILRIPRLSSVGLEPEPNLYYQEACFSRASVSGHTPKILDKIAPCKGIPWGALVISEIEGSTPILPNDLQAIADALAAIHSLPVPFNGSRPPIPSHDDPISRTFSVIEEQSKFFDKAGVDPAARSQLDEELEKARRFSEEVTNANLPVTLVGTDTHPGNFLIGTDGRATFVDLEKMLYGLPAIDLAHATVYTSTMWDPDVATDLGNAEVAEFYGHYFSAIPEILRAQIIPWCAPIRRFTWLRTMTWCGKWRVQSRNGAAWSVTQNDPTYIQAVRRRIDDYFLPETIERVRTGFDSAPIIDN